MATTSDIKNGLCIEFNNDTWQIIGFQHVKPGRGGAFVRTKLKSLSNGKVLDNTFLAGHKINDVRIERRKFQFLYMEGEDYHFMDNETFEQVNIMQTMIDNPKLMKEGMEVEVVFHADKGIPLTIDMPQYVVLEVTYTEPGLKGDTTSSALKKATVETGAEIKVPLFVDQGTKIKIDTKTNAYVERVK